MLFIGLIIRGGGSGWKEGNQLLKKEKEKKKDVNECPEIEI